MKEWIGRWKGQTVVCIASGPSLTQADCDAVHASGLKTIVTNTTFRRCLWADALMGFDCKWWKEYGAEVSKTFKGARFAYPLGAKQYGARPLFQEKWFKHFHNSGASAVSLAIAAGAARVLMLGYDCQKTGGRTHWHPDHPGPLGNARSLANWPTQFKNVARFADQQGVSVVNVSRETALKMFPRISLEKALGIEEAVAA